ncbi:cytochrome c and c1 heme-lyase [Hortaea werneckii]|nr:cytochrome c and c1 heme-lyase [Hortaea werneckii]
MRLRAYGPRCPRSSACGPTLASSHHLEKTRQLSWLAILLSRLGAVGRYQPQSHTHLDPLPRVQLRPDVEIEVQTLARQALILARVEVNHVVHMLPATIHHPIMPIKGGGVSHQAVPSRFRRQGLAVTGEGDQLRAATSLAAPSFLPPLDLSPCPLVHGIVDGDDARHVLSLGLMPFALHRVEEHLLARVDPVAGLPIVAGVPLRIGRRHGRSFRRIGRAGLGEGTWDGRDFPVLREAEELRLPVGRGGGGGQG